MGSRKSEARFCDTPPQRQYALRLRILDPSGPRPANRLEEVETIRDRDLLAAFRLGERDALERVYRDHVVDVTACVRAGFMYTSNDRPKHFPGARDALELESLVQEVFARAFEPRARLAYDGVRPYGAFLTGIARNVVLDRLRKQARSGEVLVAPDTLDSALRPPEPDDDPDERRGRELVTNFLATDCDERDRTLYALRYERGLSQVETAGSVRLTRIQVRRWETKFRARLLRFLKRADYVRDR